MWFEAPHAQAQLRRGHRLRRRATSSSRRATPTTSAASTRSASRQPQLIAQANIHACQADDERIHGLRIRRSLPFFADVMGQPDFARGDDAEIPPLAEAGARPTSRSTTRTRFECGGRRIECISVPGGETIDSLVVWLPDDGVALVGNMFSALFGHFPNLVTMRGDRMRNALAFVDSVQTRDRSRTRVAAARPSRPGARRARRSAPSANASATRRCTCTTRPIAAMNDGRDVWTAMREIALPEHLELGEAYGRVDWSVRAIWETYAGWFHQHSTLDLYGAPPEQGAARDRRARRRGRRGGGARGDARRHRSAHRDSPLRARARGRRRAPRRARRVPARLTSSCSPNTARRTSGSRAGSKARSAARRTGSSASTADERVDPHRRSPRAAARPTTSAPRSTTSRRSTSRSTHDAMLAAARDRAAVRRLRRSRTSARASTR